VGASGDLGALRIRQVLVIHPDRPLPGLSVELSWCCHGFQSSLLDRNPPTDPGRFTEKGKPAGQRRASGRLVEGQVTTNWKQALAQLAAAYPDRINPYL